MARYIDAYELLNNLPNDLPYKASVKRVLMQAPVVEVVPKSEVERLEHILDSYALQYGTATDQQKVIDKAKAEVAREIFEEIEKLSREFMNNEHYIFGDMLWDIAELKKKYTEVSYD